MINFLIFVKNCNMDIRCRKTQCIYNNKYTCTAKEIKINKKILCSTFVKSNKQPLDTSRLIFQRAPDYAPQRESKPKDIFCEANCLFNQDKKCEANGITINELKNCPYCITYLKNDDTKNKNR